MLCTYTYASQTQESGLVLLRDTSHIILCQQLTFHIFDGLVSGKILIDVIIHCSRLDTSAMGPKIEQKSLTKELNMDNHLLLSSRSRLDVSSASLLIPAHPFNVTLKRHR